MEWIFLTPPWDHRSKAIWEELCQQAQTHGVHLVIVRLDTRQGIQLADRYGEIGQSYPALIATRGGQLVKIMTGEAILREFGSFLEEVRARDGEGQQGEKGEETDGHRKQEGPP